MAKRKIPGLAKSKGMQSMFTLFPPGKFAFTVANYSEKDSKKGTCTIHTLKLRCDEALEPSGGDMVGKIYFQRLIEMHEDHESFEEYGYIFVDELKSIIDAAGLEIKASAFDFTDLEEASFVATVAQSDGQDAEGNSRKENKINKYEAL